jgi:AraC family transcriptional regulator of adaptative response / DNA-3-methyladenine glycosylase II
VYTRALAAKDARFDGVFFVGITTTHVYCRPVCKSREAASEHRRFFETAAAAERAGFRPCLRCRPELAPGRPAVVDVVSQLAQSAVQRIAAGALNGHRVADLAHDLGVSERHVRRALQRRMGVSPLDLARTQRLLLAKRLLVDTDLPVTRVAYASGFESLRRFNAVFREQYGMPPSALRRAPRARRAPVPSDDAELLHLTLAYRAPFAWDALLDWLAAEATPGVELVEGHRYGRTVRLGDQRGVVFAEDAPGHLAIAVSASLLPALMPLIAGLRRLFDLDAEPAVVDAHLEQGGLGALVARRPGLRIPGALDGFDVALRSLLGAGGRSGPAVRGLAGRVAQTLGEPLGTGVPSLNCLAPSAARIAEAGAERLMALGVPRRRAECIARLAGAVASGALRLEPGRHVAATRRALLEIDGVTDWLATLVVMRTLYWPDAFPATHRGLQRAAGVSSARALFARAEPWRPWRAYAAVHLWSAGVEPRSAPPDATRPPAAAIHRRDVDDPAVEFA